MFSDDDKTLVGMRAWNVTTGLDFLLVATGLGS